MTIRRGAIHVCLLLSFVVAACGGSSSAVETLAPAGPQGFVHDGEQRSYYISAPDTIDAETALVFVLHGHGGRASTYEPRGPDLADAYNAVVVFPQGLDDPNGRTHWNAGFDFGIVDDAGFLSSLATELRDHYEIAPDRVFTGGISNGGWMSFHLVGEHRDVFHGAGSMVGRMGGFDWDNRDRFEPTPIIQISGELDGWQRDMTDDRRGGWGGAPDMDTIIEFWIDLNGASTVESGRVTDGTTLTKYIDGVGGSSVFYYLNEGVGHDVTTSDDAGYIDSWSTMFEFFTQVAAPALS